MNMKDQYNKDFKKMRDALMSQITNNSNIDKTLIEQFANNDFTLLEEHTVISKIILDSVKTLNEAYKIVPGVLSEIKDDAVELDLDEVMKSLD